MAINRAATRMVQLLVIAAILSNMARGRRGVAGAAILQSIDPGGNYKFKQFVC
jgi:hypothetical protein